MDTTARDYYPPGDLRVSDSDRDLALSELSEAFQVGRITPDEFDQRSGQVLRARTGTELTAPLADLPLGRAREARATAVERARRTRVAIRACAAAATVFATVAAASALNRGPTLQQREFLRAMLAHQGVSIPVPPAPSFDWAGTLTPGVIAVLLVAAIIFLRTDRKSPGSC